MLYQEGFGKIRWTFKDSDLAYYEVAKYAVVTSPSSLTVKTDILSASIYQTTESLTHSPARSFYDALPPSAYARRHLFNHSIPLARLRDDVDMLMAAASESGRNFERILPYVNACFSEIFTALLNKHDLLQANMTDKCHQSSHEIHVYLQYNIRTLQSQILSVECAGWDTFLGTRGALASSMTSEDHRRARMEVWLVQMK